LVQYHLGPTYVGRRDDAMFAFRRSLQDDKFRHAPDARRRLTDSKGPRVP
jgi:hypothetical protein